MPNLILVWGIITSFLFPNLSNIRSVDKNINILVMGAAGGSHEGPELTDTLILVTIDTETKKISTVSIPRDLWLPDLKTKINATYFYGKNKLSKEVVGEVFGTWVDYSVLIDFSGFKNVIDAIGGIDVVVENDFTDKLYPIEGREDDKCIPCRYEVVEFKKGVNHMDGETALKFVRSRHAEGEEGTDIAREKRQQIVINSVKDKLTAPKNFLNIKKDIEVYKSIRSAVKIDFDEKSASVIARKMFDSRKNVKNYTIPEDLLFYPKNNLKLYGNQYVFIPKLGNGKWEDIQKWYKEILN